VEIGAKYDYQRCLWGCLTEGLRWRASRTLSLCL